VLLVDSDRVLPTSVSVHTGIEKLAGNLGKAGVTVTRESPLLPNFAESSRLYMRMLMSFLGAFFPPEVVARVQAGVAQLRPDDTSLAAERLRGLCSAIAAG
jgi:amidase